MLCMGLKPPSGPRSRSSQSESDFARIGITSGDHLTAKLLVLLLLVFNGECVMKGPILGERLNKGG